MAQRHYLDRRHYSDSRLNMAVYYIRVLSALWRLLSLSETETVYQEEAVIQRSNKWKPRSAVEKTTRVTAKSSSTLRWRIAEHRPDGWRFIRPLNWGQERSGQCNDCFCFFSSDYVSIGLDLVAKGMSESQSSFRDHFDRGGLDSKSCRPTHNGQRFDSQTGFVYVQYILYGRRTLV